MLRFSGGNECEGDETSLSPTRISPLLGSTNPAINRSVVVLPQPEGPSRQTRWPCSMVSVMLSTTATSPYRLVRSRNSTDATRFLLPLFLPLPVCGERSAAEGSRVRGILLCRSFRGPSPRPSPRKRGEGESYEPVKAGLRFSMKALRPSV